MGSENIVKPTLPVTQICHWCNSDITKAKASLLDRWIAAYLKEEANGCDNPKLLVLVHLVVVGNWKEIIYHKYTQK